MIHIRRATHNDIDPIRFLFRDTIQAINSRHYSKREVEVWSEGFQRTGSWSRHISNQHFIVAEAEGMIIGFSSLEKNGYLDFMYVHKDHQGKGVASALLHSIMAHALELGLPGIFSHVSLTAQPFFERKGFIKQGEHLNQVKEITFRNAIMLKTL